MRGNWCRQARNGPCKSFASLLVHLTYRSVLWTESCKHIRCRTDDNKTSGRVVGGVAYSMEEWQRRGCEGVGDANEWFVPVNYADIVLEQGRRCPQNKGGT